MLGFPEELHHFSLLGRLHVGVKRGKISYFCCKCRRQFVQPKVLDDVIRVSVVWFFLSVK